MAWRVIDANSPDRSDHYQMQTACEVRRVLRKDPATIQLEHFRLKFPDGDGSPQTDRKAKIDRQMQAMEMSLLKRGGFTREQVKEMVARARERLEGESNG